MAGAAAPAAPGVAAQAGANNGAASDPFQSNASSGIDSAQAQALAQVARSGSAQQQAINTAAANNAALKTQAIRNAMSYAALRGAPSSVVQANNATIGAPVDTSQGTLNEMAANYGADNAAQSAADSSFFQGAKAGLPAAEAGYQSTAANDVAKVQAANANAAASEQAKQLSLQIAQANLAKAQLAGTGTAGIIKQLGGAQVAGQVLGGAAQTAADNNPIDQLTPQVSAPGPVSETITPPAANGASSGGKVAHTNVGQASSAIDAQLGLPAGTTAALAGNAGLATQTKQNTVQKGLAAVANAAPTANADLYQATQNPTYPQAIAGIQGNLAKGNTVTVQGIMSAYPGFTAAQAQAMLTSAQGTVAKASTTGSATGGRNAG